MSTATTGDQIVVTPSPPLPRDPKNWRKTTAKVALIIAGVIAAIFTIAVVLVGVGAIFLSSGASPVAENGFIERVELAQVEGAPEADLVLPVDARLLADADLLLGEAGGAPMNDESVIVPGSPELLAIVHTEVGPTEIYRWAEVPVTSKLSDAPMRCIGTFGHVGQAQCVKSSVTEVSLSSGSTDEQGNFTRYLTAFDLPEDAAWMLVEAEDGYRVAAAVTDGVAFVQWIAAPEAQTQPATVRALDANFDEIWSARAP